MTNQCVSKMLNTISETESQGGVIVKGCTDRQVGESEAAFADRCNWNKCYNAWTTVGGSFGKTANVNPPTGVVSKTFVMKQQGDSTHLPQCFPESDYLGNTMNDTAQIDCLTWMKFCTEWNRKQMPLAYGCRSQYSPRLPSGDPGTTGTPGPVPGDPLD